MCVCVCVRAKSFPCVVGIISPREGNVGMLFGDLQGNTAY